MDLQELERRDKEQIEMRKQLFRNIECEKSIYLFSKENWLRRLCYQAIFHPRFETVIMCIIIGSTLKLVIDTYSD